MHILKILLSTILAATIGLVLPAQQLLAAPLPQETPGDGHGISCEGGVCSVVLDLAQTPDQVPVAALRMAPALLHVAQNNLDFLPDGLNMEVVADQLVLELPVGNIDMLDADLQVELDDEQRVERFYGTAAVPFPTLGIFEDAQLVLPGRAQVGFDTGENLAYLGAPLDPDQRYLVIHFGGGADENVDSTFSFTGDEGENSFTLIIDPTDFFVYLVGNVMLVDVSELLLADQISGGALLPMMPNLFPVPERVGGRVAMLVTDDLDDFKLEVGGGYAVDSGSLGRRLGLDVKPIAFEGEMALNRDGLTISSVANSSVQPGSFFDSKGEATIHIPFTGNADDAYVQLDTNVNAPIVGLAHDGSVTMSLDEFADQLEGIDGPGRMAQLRDRMAGATAQVGERLDGSGAAISGLVSGASDVAANVGGAVSGVVTNTVPGAVTSVGETLSGAVTGVISDTVPAIPGVVTGTVSSSIDWAAQIAGGAYDATTGGLEQTSNLLCNWFGRCAQPEPVVQGE